MLRLKLRAEFRGKRLKGTAIELANANNTGATQVPAAEFLEITYPTTDVLKAIEAVGPSQGRPVVLIGERGQGKSHIMGALHHALTDPNATRQWLADWSEKLSTPSIGAIALRDGAVVVSESLHRQHYRVLWDVLFERHPAGEFIRGKWEGAGAQKTDVPPESLLLELFRKRPTALLLDEFQTWFDGLTNTKQHPWRAWAFNFIQVLSEIAKEHPDLLVLVISVRNGATDAYQQVHRVGPLIVDFKGPNAERERRQLLLHRLFENRAQVPASDIEEATSAHVSECLRLLDIPPADHKRRREEFVQTWPFAPHLMQLLEDQVLVATDAQETRDLIRILADLYKSRGDVTPLLTAADFRLDDDSSAIASLLDSVANQHLASLREKAQRNLGAVRDVVSSPDKTVPHLTAIVGALWLRSLAVGNLAGAEPRQLQVDVTGATPVDDNAFQAELSTIVENSFNIHVDGNRLVFREDENPQAKLMACARNDRLFTDGEDHRQLAREIRYVLGGGEDVPNTFHVIVLRQPWITDPWSQLEDVDQPDRWDDRLPVVVLPEEPDRLNERLGTWLKDNLQKHRNAVRFLLPRSGSLNTFLDRDLVVLARAVLKGQEWRVQSPEYGKLHQKYQTELRRIVKDRFDRFVILKTWNFADPSQCTFHVEKLQAMGGKAPEAMEEQIRTDLFVPEDFGGFVLAAAANNESVGKILRELQEPRPPGQACIPWLGETLMKEKIIRLCAQGRVAINLRGMEYLQTVPGEGEEDAWKRMRGRLGTGKHLDETYVLLPQAVPQAQAGATAAGQVKPTLPGLGGAVVTPISGGSEVGGAATPPVPPPSTVFAPGKAGGRVPCSAPATSALNLLGRIETWGVGPATPVHNVTLRVGASTGAQLQKLLKDLPDGLIYELSLEKEE